MSLLLLYAAAVCIATIQLLLLLFKSMNIINKGIICIITLQGVGCIFVIFVARLTNGLLM